MRIERIVLDVCVSDSLTRGGALLLICESLPRTVRGVLVCEPVKREDRAAEVDAACGRQQQAESKPKRHWTRRTKTGKDGAEATDGSVKRTVTKNANGETVTTRMLENGDKVEFRR